MQKIKAASELYMDTEKKKREKAYQGSRGQGASGVRGSARAELRTPEVRPGVHGLAPQLPRASQGLHRSPLPH